MHPEALVALLAGSLATGSGVGAWQSSATVAERTVAIETKLDAALAAQTRLEDRQESHGQALAALGERVAAVEAITR